MKLKAGDRVEMYHGLFGPGTIEDMGETWARVKWDSGAVTTGLLSVLVSARPPVVFSAANPDRGLTS